MPHDRPPDDQPHRLTSRAALVLDRPDRRGACGRCGQVRNAGTRCLANCDVTHQLPAPGPTSRPPQTGACGWCGEQLTAGSMSVDFCTELHQYLWHRRRADDLPAAQSSAVVNIRVADELSAVVAAMGLVLQQVQRTFAEVVAPAFRAAAAAFQPLIAAAQRSGTLPTPLPAEPMARALALRRSRNTGPAARRRAPIRIDPTRTHR